MISWRSRAERWRLSSRISSTSWSLAVSVNSGCFSRLRTPSWTTRVSAPCSKWSSKTRTWLSTSFSTPGVSRSASDPTSSLSLPATFFRIRPASRLRAPCSTGWLISMTCCRSRFPSIRRMSRTACGSKETRSWVQQLDRPAILVANHSSHADTPLLLHALGDRVRERTVVAAAADYFYGRPWLGRVVSLWLNTFPFARSGGAQEVMHRSSVLLKSGWNLLVFPEGTRSPDGRLQPFKPGVGHLAVENRTPVIPMHVRGSQRVLPKGRNVPLPAPVRIRVGKPLSPGAGETSRDFADRVEQAVQALAKGSTSPELTGSWIERWKASDKRAPRPRARLGPEAPE